jgi:putative ABC transport system permease protein
MPGVQGTALVNKLPLDTQFNLPFRLVGHTKNTGAAQYRVISPGYFRVMQIAVRQGRHFDDKDTAGAEPVVIVNEAFARSNFSGIEPIGQQVFVCCERWRRVVGVVSETKQRSLTEAAPAAVFIPVAQAEEGARDLLRQGSFVLRMASDPSLLSAAVIQSEVHHIDSAVPVRAVRPMEQLVSRSIASQRFNLFVLGLFAILGLLLAAVGIYSVMAYGVSQRTHEIGLRLALGAQSRDVLTLIVKQGMTPALVGLIVGLIASLGLTRSMQSLLFGVEAIDALTLAIMSLTVTIVALLACWIPARRVAKVDPMIALR